VSSRFNVLLVSRQGAEVQLLRIAKALEQTTRFASGQPPLRRT
jgi:Asp-tRNA(Asn)/Glu-tRNA(Gln) amidotransferase A subunit family amidase